MSDQVEDTPETKETEQEQDQQTHMIPYDRFKTVIDERNDLKTRLAALEEQVNQQSKQKGKKADKLAELEQQITALQQERDAERMKSLRIEVAQEAGLPLGLASRLNGDDAESLLADAQKLLSDLPKAPPTQGNLPRGRHKPQSAITQEQLNDPKWVLDNRDKIAAAAIAGTLPN